MPLESLRPSRRFFAFGLAVLLALGLPAGVAAAEPAAEPAVAAADLEEGLMHVSLSGFEFSGVARVEGGLLLAEDELVGALFFAPLASGDDLAGPLAATYVKLERKRGDSRPNTAAPRLAAYQDFEDLERGEGDDIYLLASHNTKKDGKKHERRPDREAILRAEWDGAELRWTGEYTALLDDLQAAVDEGLLGKAGKALDLGVKQKSLKTSFDAEGLAWRAGRLYIGLREPLGADNTALLISLDTEAAFDAPAPANVEARLASMRLHALPLGGPLGDSPGGRAVRGLTRDAVTDRLLILAGPGDDGGRDFALFDWSPDDDAPPSLRHTFPAAQIERLGAPEGIARFDADHLLVAFDDERAHQGHLLLLPWR